MESEPEPETLDDGHGQAVTTADELIDPYLKAREDLLKKINGRWSELERIFADHGCDILHAELGQGQSETTGERYPTFTLKIGGKAGSPWSHLKIVFEDFRNCDQAIKIGSRFEIVCKVVANWLCENTPLDPASKAALNKEMIPLQDLPASRRITTYFSVLRESFEPPLTANYYDFVKYAGPGLSAEDTWILNPIRTVVAESSQYKEIVSKIQHDREPGCIRFWVRECFL